MLELVISRGLWSIKIIRRLQYLITWSLTVKDASMRSVAKKHQSVTLSDAIAISPVFLLFFLLQGVMKRHSIKIEGSGIFTRSSYWGSMFSFTILFYEKEKLENVGQKTHSKPFIWQENNSIIDVLQARKFFCPRNKKIAPSLKPDDSIRLVVCYQFVAISKRRAYCYFYLLIWY